jgi:hypothetical protein
MTDNERMQQTIAFYSDWLTRSGLSNDAVPTHLMGWAMDQRMGGLTQGLRALGLICGRALRQRYISRTELRRVRPDMSAKLEAFLAARGLA